MTDRKIKGPIKLLAWGPDLTGLGTYQRMESTVGQPVEDAAAQAVEQDKQVAKETAFVPAGKTPDGDTVFTQEEAGLRLGLRRPTSTRPHRCRPRPRST